MHVCSNFRDAGRVVAPSSPASRLESGAPVYAFAAPILNMRVLHVGQEPSVAGLPFFMVIGFGSFISRFSRHFRQ
jgi:hypothetical protein